jgi:hypothetical protein
VILPLLVFPGPRLVMPSSQRPLMTYQNNLSIHVSQSFGVGIADDLGLARFAGSTYGSGPVVAAAVGAA